MSQVQGINLEMATPTIRNALFAAQTETGLAIYRPQALPEFVGVGLRDILRSWRLTHTVIMSDEYSQNAVKAAAVAELLTMTSQAVDDLELRFKSELEKTRRELDGGVLPIAPDQAMRLWTRLKAQLDAGVELPDLLADADVVTLQVLTEELPAWHRTRMPGDAHVAAQVCNGDLAQVRQRRWQLATPELRSKMEFADSLAPGEKRTDMAFVHARHHVKHSTARETLTLPTWTGATIVV